MYNYRSILTFIAGKQTKLVCHPYKSVKFFFSSFVSKIQAYNTIRQKKGKIPKRNRISRAPKMRIFLFLSPSLPLSWSLEEAKYRSIPEREGVDDARGAARYTP